MTTNTKRNSPAKQPTRERGFTIVESLVAISILVLAITGTASAIQIGISSYIFSKDQVIAFYLAQEGFEQIRNMRDENRLTGGFWLSSIADASSDPCYFGQACTVDPVFSNEATRCSAPGSCPVLRQDSVNGFFGYNLDWPESIFTREIVLTEISENEISVLVTVSWTKGIVDREFQARENLLNY